LRHAEARRRAAPRRRRGVGGDPEVPGLAVIPRLRDAEARIVDADDGRLVELGEVRLGEDARPGSGGADLTEHLQRAQLAAGVRLVAAEPPAEAVALVAEEARLEVALGDLAQALLGRQVAELARQQQAGRREAGIADQLQDRLVRVAPAEQRRRLLVEELGERSVL